MAKSKGKSSSLSKSKKLKINFSGVDKEIKSGARAARVPEGDYLVKIIKHELRKNKNDDGRHISWQFQIVSPKKYKGKTLYDITALKPDALWNLRNLIHAATGKNVAGKAIDFNPENLYGKIVAVTVEDDEYDGKIKSRPVDVRPKEELTQGDDDDEDEDEDDEDEEDEEDDEDDDDEEDSDDDDEDEDLDDVDVDDI